MSDALVVPIRVEALAVGARDDVRTVAPYADFAAVEGRFAPYVGAQVVNRAFSGARPLEPGVHLHWHLPRALRRAAITAQRPAPPPAPDRWLVVRRSRERGEARAWVVESNFLADEPLYSETTFPGDVNRGERLFSYLGRVYELEDWPGSGGRYVEALDAFGYGIPDFAGCYANCRNVFGLHDAEPTAGTLSYAVVGWHDDPACDPLQRGGLEAHGWRLDDAGPGPERTLYLGAIRGVPFDPGAEHLAAHRPAPVPDLAIGNTPAEALAALAAGRQRDTERLFTAFQIGALRRLSDLAGIEEQIHAASFASVDAGSTWELQATGADALADVSPRLARELSWLNLRQRAFDTLRAEQTAVRRRIFADWCRRAELRAARRRPELDLDGLDGLIEAQIQLLESQQARLERHVFKLGVRRHRLRVRLPPGVKLVRNAAPRYYRPNDPVVVLAGDGIAAPAPDLTDSLACARSSALSAPPDGPALAGEDRLPLPGTARLAWLGVLGESDAGLPEPAIALREWELPWRPVELAWRVALQLPEELETGAPLPPDFVLANFTLDERALDFEPPDDDFDVLPDVYEGRAPLAANASAALETQLEGVVGDELLTQLRDKPIVAQSLGGFTHALGMLDLTLQLGVADPGGSPLEAPFVRRVAEAVGDEARFGPLPDNPFTPLRSGRFSLRALRLVDEFGRWREIDTAGIVVAETVPRVGRAVLPPLRLTQAAQLRFRWRIGGRGHSEASVAPAASPVCGWVVPNRLDGGIVLYDRDGAVIVRLVPGERGTEWFTPPGVATPDGLAEVLAGRNPVVAAFAAGLAADRPGYLSAFTDTLDAARTFIAPALTGADRETAVLLGMPLALVQAELDLALLGLPQIDMSLAALREDIRRGDPLVRGDRGLTGVRFGVRLGNLPQADDGLIGFFAPRADGEPDFGTFYAAAGGGHEGIAEPQPDTLTVTAGDRPALVVTMLIDPRCPVHAATGILPVKSLALPGDLMTRSLGALEYTFLTGPLIVPPGPAQAPAPAAATGWSWLDRGGEGHAWQEHPLGGFDPGLPPDGRQRIVDGWLRLDRRRAG